MNDDTYSKWHNHIVSHNPILEYNQESCEACYLWSLGLVEFTGETRLSQQDTRSTQKPTKGKQKIATNHHRKER